LNLIVFKCGKPKDSTPKLLELIQQFSSVAGYKINAQKSVAFLHTNNANVEREIRETIPFTIAPKTIRYLRISLTKEVKDLYTRNYRTLMKEIEEDTKMEKHSMLMDRKNKHCYNVCAAQSNLYLQRHPNQNTNGIFQSAGTNNPKICVEPEKTPNRQGNVAKDNTSFNTFTILHILNFLRPII